MSKLSIIIPTYNSALALGRTLDSIVKQTFTNWEVLIMDGVSTDDTVKIAQSFNDNRIRIFIGPDEGIYDALNKGIMNAEGEWLYFLGSDDYLLTTESIQKVFSNKTDGYDIIYGDVQSPSLPQVNRGEWFIDSLSANRCHQAIFYRRTLFSKLGLYNLRYPYLADFEFNLRWFLNKKIKNKYIPIEIANFSPGGISESKNDEQFWKDFDYLIIKYGYSRLNTTQKIHYISNAIDKEKNIIKLLVLNVVLVINKTKKQARKILRKTTKESQLTY